MRSRARVSRCSSELFDASPTPAESAGQGVLVLVPACGCDSTMADASDEGSRYETTLRARARVDVTPVDLDDIFQRNSTTTTPSRLI